MAKHFVRLNEKNEITHGFSDDFGQPLETDICINENGGRQFELLGDTNPNLQELSVYLYKVIDNEIIKKTQQEIQQEVKSMPVELSEIEKLKIRQDASENALLFLMEMGMM